MQHSDKINYIALHSSNYKLAKNCKIVVSPEKHKTNKIPTNTYFLLNVYSAKIKYVSWPELIILKKYIQDKMTEKSEDPNYNLQ